MYPFRSLYVLATSGLGIVLAGGLSEDTSSYSRLDPQQLDNLVPILDESFQEPLNRYDMKTGLWWTLGRRSVLMTNSSQSVFIDQNRLVGTGRSFPNLHEVGPDGLELRTARLSQDQLQAIQSYMVQTGQGARASDILYGTARISTEHTWAQTYGYFEIEARIPKGKGRWPAFWLTMAGPGWPPEIDVFEAYGAGLSRPTPKDDTFSTGVFFDAFNAAGDAVHSVDLNNTFGAAGEPDQPDVKQRSGRDVFSFSRDHDATYFEQADIYNDFHIWSALWTKNEIIFYFGPDRESLREIYRVPTPDDVHVPQYIIANDQFTARGGWWQPREDVIEDVLDPHNAFVIRRIRILALPPEHLIELEVGESAFDPRGSLIRDTPGDDMIAPGPGLDIIELSGGADRIELARGRHGTIVSGFGADDSLMFEGDVFVSAKDAFSRLTQVGNDVWLPNGGNGGWPQSVIFRNARVEEFSPLQFDVRWPITPDLHWWHASHPEDMIKGTEKDGTITAPYVGVRLSDDGAALHMVGSAGPDTYFVWNRESTIREHPGGGTDTVITGVTIDIPVHVEHINGRSAGILIRGSAAEERLTAEAERITLDGRGGDDLFVIAPDIVRATIRIRPGDGHDRIRGFRPDQHRLELAGAIGKTVVKQGPSGALLVLGSHQSVLFEGVSLADAQLIVGATRAVID